MVSGWGPALRWYCEIRVAECRLARHCEEGAPSGGKLRARCGNPVVGHRVGGIEIWPGAPRHGSHEGGGTQMTQIYTQMTLMASCTGSVRRLGRGSGEVGVGSVLRFRGRTPDTELLGRSPSPLHGEGDRG